MAEGSISAEAANLFPFAFNLSLLVTKSKNAVFLSLLPADDYLALVCLLVFVMRHLSLSVQG